MRLIDADANIETMKKCSANPENEQALLCYRFTQRILEEAPTVEPASPWHRVEEPPKWVSVFDDLPRHNAVVVVSDGKRSWDVGQYHFLFKADDRTIWWWKKHTTRKVLWWMYKEDAIPEPPKEEGR